MTAVIRGELLKALTTRTLLGYAAAALGLAVANVLIVSGTSDLDTVADKRDALAGMPLLLVLLGLVGAAGEYRHRPAAPAALVARRGRGSVLLARASAYGLLGLAVGAATSAVSLGLGLPLLAGEPGPDLHTGQVAAVVGGTMLGGALAGVLGAAAGALVRNQAAGAVGVLLLAFMGTEFLEAIDEDAVGFSPFGAALAVAAYPGGGTLGWGVSALVLGAWTAALLAAAVTAERGRDLA